MRKWEDVMLNAEAMRCACTFKSEYSVTIMQARSSKISTKSQIVNIPFNPAIIV